MRYVLEDLFRIRKVREDRAEREVVLKRRKVEVAQRELLRCREELAAYQKWRAEEEDRLFQKLRETLVHVGAIEAFHQDIVLLREREREKMQKVEEAKKRLDEANRALDDAKDAYRKAVQGSQKIEEHRRIWVREARREEELQADKELEEFASERLRQHEG